METLLRLTRKYSGRISAQAGPLAEARGWLEMIRARKEGVEQLPNRGFLTGCGGFMTKMAVRADGVMVPCNLVPAWNWAVSTGTTWERCGGTIPNSTVSGTAGAFRFPILNTAATATT